MLTKCLSIFINFTAKYIKVLISERVTTTLFAVELHRNNTKNPQNETFINNEVYLLYTMVDNQKKLFNTIIKELKDSFEELKEPSLNFNTYVACFFQFRNNK